MGIEKYFDVHNNNIELIQWYRYSCRLFAVLKPLSAPLSLYLLQLCKSERASSVASERGKLGTYTQIQCFRCIVCVCVRVVFL